MWKPKNQVKETGKIFLIMDILAVSAHSIIKALAEGKFGYWNLN